jgi:3-hydroxyisobutyrate dehydrogenase
MNVRVGRIAFVGLGRMGAPMSRRLMAAGFSLTAFDGRPEAGSESSVRRVGSTAAAVSGAEILITVLPGPREVLEVLPEAARGLRADACWLEMSTACPAVAEAIAAQGIKSVDAPVGGGPAAAADGRLVAFAGGTAADLDRCRQVLDVLTERVIHVGAAGSGYAVKLLVNALWFAQACSSAEALALGRRLGLDLDALLGALNESAAASRFLSRDAPALLAGDDMTSFSLARCHEELASVLSLADSHGVPVDVLTSVASLHALALARYGDVEGELLGARFVGERAGVSFADGRGRARLGR